MLGRKNYTQEEIDHAKAAVDQQLAAYTVLVAAIGKKPTEGIQAAVDEFEAIFFNKPVLVLERFFVHRLRMVAGKDGNPLNEVELVSDSLMNSDGTLRGSRVIKFNSDESVLKLAIGDPIRTTEAQFARLAEACFGEPERKFR